MGKYLITWALNKEIIPKDLDEYDKMMKMLSQQIKENFKSGITDWGLFSNNNGYVIFEGNMTGMMIGQRAFVPFIEFLDVQEVLNREEADLVHQESMNIKRAVKPP